MLEYLPRFLCDYINPALVGFVLAELFRYPPGAPGRERWTRAALFFLRTTLAVGLAVVVAEGSKGHVWPGHHGFPSGHATMAASLAVCVLAQRGIRRAWPAAVLGLVMPFALVWLGAHAPLEAAAGTLWGTAAAFTVWKLTERLSGVNRPYSGCGTGPNGTE